MDIVIALVGIALAVWNAVSRRRVDAHVERDAPPVLAGIR
jgi:hypothetical protein